MSDDKKDFFDYDTYIQSSVGKIKNGGKSAPKGKKAEHTRQPSARQKPPKLVPADAEDKRKKPEHDSIESIKKMFGEALDESKEELAEFAGEEPAAPDAPEANPEGIRRKLYCLFGINDKLFDRRDKGLCRQHTAEKRVCEIRVSYRNMRPRAL